MKRETTKKGPLTSNEKLKTEVDKVLEKLATRDYSSLDKEDTRAD
jgi:hypothetical protein